MSDPSFSIDLDDWALLELTGEDRLQWLQGQATNDVRNLKPGSRASFCFCEPTGQMLAVVDAWALEDRILMTTARERAGAVLERVERMTILEDVAVRDLSGEYRGFSVSGTFEWRAQLAPAALVLRADRTGEEGWDIWIPTGTQTTNPNHLDGLAKTAPEAYEAARIAAGIPRWSVDMGPRTLPPELGSAFEARHLSYAKGCYTGQEVLMRMHTRGHTNRTWVGLVSTVPLSAGSTVLHHGTEVGRVTSASSHPGAGERYVAAATVRNEASADGTEVTVGDQRVEVRQMPIRRAA